MLEQIVTSRFYVALVGVCSIHQTHAADSPQSINTVCLFVGRVTPICFDGRLADNSFSALK